MPDVRYGTVSGFAAVAAEAHRRRTSSAKALALGIATVAVLGGSAGLVGRPGATDRLDPVAPTPSATVRVSPGPVARPLPSAASGPRSVARPVATATSPVRPVRPTPVVTPRDPSPSASPAARTPRSTTTTLYQYDKEPWVCLVDPSCLVMGAPSVTATRVGLFVDFCTNEARVLEFADDVEAEFRVVDSAGRTIWRSIVDRPARPARHVVDVGEDRCAQWKLWWLRRGDEGTPAATGSYRAYVRLRSPQVTTEASVDFYLED